MGSAAHQIDGRKVERTLPFETQGPRGVSGEEAEAHRDQDQEGGGAAQERSEEGQGKRRKEREGARGSGFILDPSVSADYELQLEEDCHFVEVFPAEGTAAILSVPGALAPISNIGKLWNSLVRWILSGKSGFARFLRTLGRHEPLADKGTAQPVWPVPAPYPQWMVRVEKSKVNYKQMYVEKAVNLMILSSSWLHLGKPLVAPATLALGSSLTKKQWGVVKRYERLISEFLQVGDIGPAAMGRSAAKVESLSSLLVELETAAAKTAAPYEHRPAAQRSDGNEPQPGHQKGDPGRVVGRLQKPAPQLAKCVEPSRLSFPQDAPAFDPSSMLEEPHKKVYEDPISCAISPEDFSLEPPRVRVHGSKDQALGLFRFLDQHHRLRLVPREKVRDGFLCGAFCLVKDEKKDRLILDARPPNMLEETLCSWTKTLGSVNAILQIELEPGCSLSMSGTDLRDYYYCFKVTKQRACRNTFNFPLSPAQASELHCFTPDMWQHSTLYPCLATMAMGDCQAVEMGQMVHVKIGMQCEAIHPHELLCVHGRGPRGKISCGVIIDDAVFLEQVPAMLTPAELRRTDGAKRLRAIKEEYVGKNLTPHDGKTFEAEFEAEFWGASVNGIAGSIRANPKRLIPLMDLTAKTARLGFATMLLLQTLAGAWISVLQFRRRMLCLLDEIYVAQHGREEDMIIELSPSLQSELWILVCLGPLAVTDLRAQTLGKLFLTDASEDMKASVVSALPLPFARELHRHALARGAWTRLLTPWKVWLKQHFQLDEEDAMPDGVPLVSHPLWLILAQCLRFELHHRKRVGSRRHINLLEMESLLELEKKIAAYQQDSRYLCGCDSQIVIAAVLKGRSSSPHLNELLQKSLPTVLGAGLYGSYGYIPSKANVSDDPTRWTDIRPPSRPIPDWLFAAFSGCFDALDVWLGERGYDPLDIAQLPFPLRTAPKADVLEHSLIAELRAVQKTERLAKFDQKIYGTDPKDWKTFETPATGANEQKDHKRPQDAELAFGPHHAVVSKKTEEQNCVGSNTVSSSHVSPVLVAKDEGVQEPDGQTKNSNEEPPGKTNRRHLNLFVGCEGRPQPAEMKKVVGTGSPDEPPVGESVSRRQRGGLAMENVKSALLSSEARAALALLPRECFIKPDGRRARPDEVLDFQRKGFLDLFSGKASFARPMARRFSVFVVTFDFEHSPRQDLLNESLRSDIKRCLLAGCFHGMGAAPECCSFSRAVTPAVRSALRPEGLPQISENMQRKVRGKQSCTVSFGAFSYLPRNGPALLG